MIIQYFLSFYPNNIYVTFCSLNTLSTRKSDYITQIRIVKSSVQPPLKLINILFFKGNRFNQFTKMKETVYKIKEKSHTWLKAKLN